MCIENQWGHPGHDLACVRKVNPSHRTPKTNTFTYASAFLIWEIGILASCSKKYERFDDELDLERQEFKPSFFCPIKYLDRVGSPIQPTRLDDLVDIEERLKWNFILFPNLHFYHWYSTLTLTLIFDINYVYSLITIKIVLPKFSSTSLLKIIKIISS